MIDFEKRYVFTRAKFSKFKYRYNIEKNKPVTFGFTYNSDRGSYRDFGEIYFIENGIADFPMKYSVTKVLNSFFIKNHAIVKNGSHSDFSKKYMIDKSSYLTLPFYYSVQMSKVSDFNKRYALSKSGRVSFSKKFAISRKRIILFTKQTNITKLSFKSKEDWGFVYSFGQELLNTSGRIANLDPFVSTAKITMLSESSSGNLSDMTVPMLILSTRPADTAAGFSVLSGRLSVSEHYNTLSLYQYGIQFDYKERSSIDGIYSKIGTIELAASSLDDLTSNKIIFQFNRVVVDYEDFSPDSFKLQIRPSSARMSNTGANISIPNHDNKYNMADSNYFGFVKFPDIIRNDDSLFSGLGFIQKFIIDNKRSLFPSGSIRSISIETYHLGRETEYPISGFKNMFITTSSNISGKTTKLGSVSNVFIVGMRINEDLKNISSSGLTLYHSQLTNRVLLADSFYPVKYSPRSVYFTQGTKSWISRKVLISPSPLLSNVAEHGYTSIDSKGQPEGGLVIGIKFETNAGANKIVKEIGGFVSKSIILRISEIQTDVDGISVGISVLKNTTDDFYYAMHAHQSYDLSDMYYEAEGSIVSEITNLGPTRTVSSRFQAEILYNALNIISAEINLKVA